MSAKFRGNRALSFHSAVAGLGWGATGIAGSALVLVDASNVADGAVMIAMSIVAFLVGLWVGAADSRADELPVRDRWLTAAATTAIGGLIATLAILYEPAFPDFPWRILNLVFAVALPAYAVGRIPPILLAIGERAVEKEDDEIDSLTVVRTVVFGLLIGAACSMILVGPMLGVGWRPQSVLMATAVVLIAPRIFGIPVGDGVQEEVIHEEASPLGVWTVTEIAFGGEKQPERRLYLNDEEESGEFVRSGVPTLAYVAVAEQWLASNTPRGADYLFLGGGAYTLPRRIAERDPAAGLVVVELDPEATNLAGRFFGLQSRHGIHSVHGDARAYINSAGDVTFDRIYVDVYGGREAVPYSLVTHEAAEQMAGLLKPGGMLGMNLIGNTTGKEAIQLWSVVRSYAGAFPALDVYTHIGRDYPERQNLLLVASLQPAERVHASIGSFDLWPRQEWPPAEDAVIFRDVSIPAAERPAAHYSGDG